MSMQLLAKTPVWKAAALLAGFGLAMLSTPCHAAPGSGGDTVQGLYDSLLGVSSSAPAGTRREPVPA